MKTEYELMLDLAKRSSSATQFLISISDDQACATNVARAIKRYEEFLENTLFAKNKKIKELEDELANIYD
ncbi:hypothetical protein V6O07_12220 [Arthrospira platensis SPKY2]